MNKFLDNIPVADIFGDRLLPDSSCEYGGFDDVTPDHELHLNRVVDLGDFVGGSVEKTITVRYFQCLKLSLYNNLIHTQPEDSLSFSDPRSTRCKRSFRLYWVSVIVYLL